MNTTATFSGYLHTADASPALWQWDYGQKLYIRGVSLPTVYEVHFCCAGDEETILQISDTDGVSVPDECLETGKNIYAYIYLHNGNDDGETVYKITIPVIPRARPADRTPDETTRSVIAEVLNLLDRIAAGGFGGQSSGTWDYTQLLNLPKINGHTVTGDQTAGEFGLVNAVQGKGLSTNDYSNTAKAIVELIASLINNSNNGKAIGVQNGELAAVDIAADVETPSINGHELSGNQTGAQLGLVDAVSGKVLSDNNYTDAEKAKLASAVTQDEMTQALAGKVSVEAGKGLSANDYTNADKEKLSQTVSQDELAAAMSNVQNELTFDNAPTQSSDNPVTSGGVYTALSGKQDAENGKGLSTNDYTAAAKAIVDILIALAVAANNGKALGISDGTIAAVEMPEPPASPQINGHELTGNQTGEQLGLVDAVSGKMLSDNNYTTEEKTKLASAVTQDELAEAVADVQGSLTFDDAPTAGSGNPVTSGGVYTALLRKADAVAGKGLSTNDYTNEDKAKLDCAATQSDLTAAVAACVTSDDLSSVMKDNAPNWDAESGDSGYIKHRTHYSTHTISSVDTLNREINAAQTGVGTVTIGSRKYHYASTVNKSDAGFVLSLGLSYEVAYGGKRQVVPCTYYKVTNSREERRLEADDIGILIIEEEQYFVFYGVAGTARGTVRVRQAIGENITKLDKKYLDLSTSPGEHDSRPIRSDAVATALSYKVDKVQGKQLSDNNYTDAEKAKVASAVTQDELTQALAGKVDAESGKALSDNNYSDAEKTKLANAVTLDTLAAMLDDMQGKLTFDDAPTSGSDNPVTSDGIYAAIHELEEQIAAVRAIVNAMAEAEESDFAAVADDYLVLAGGAHMGQDGYLVLPNATVEDDYLII